MSKDAPRLNGIRVMVTRPRERAAELCFMLEDEGAEIVPLPLLEFLPPSDDRPLRAAAERISRYSWIVFSSSNGASALAEAVRSAGTVRELRRARCAAIGSATARTARELGLNVIVEAEVSTSTGLFHSLRAHLEEDDEILLPVAEEGRPELEQQLRENGFSVTRVAAYQTATLEPHPGEWEWILVSPPDYIVFASPRTAEAFLSLRDSKKVLDCSSLIAIGPTTAEAMRKLSLTPTAVAASPTAASIVEAVALAAERPSQKESDIK